MAEMTEDELMAMINELEAGDSKSPSAEAVRESAAAIKKVVESNPPALSKAAVEELTAMESMPPEPVAPTPFVEPEPATIEPVAVATPEPVASVAAAPVAEATPEAPVVAPEAPPASEKTVVMGESMLNRFIDTDALKRDVGINAADLDSAMMNHASLYVHYATQTVNARRQYERLKNGVEILEAKLDAEYRESLPGEGKKVTETAIRNALVADRRYSGAQGRLIEAQSIWKLCEVAESALVQRKDLILEIARDRRKEREGQLRVQEGQSMRDSVIDMIRKAA